MHVGLAQQDRAGIAQLLQHWRVLRRDEIGEGRGAGRTRQSSSVDVVLDHDGNTGQRLQRCAGAAYIVGRPCRIQCAPGIERDVDIQFPTLFCPLQAGADQFGAAESAIAEGGHGLADGQVGNHRAILVIEQIHMGS
ncbi:hypothetical protein D3C78_1391290 [compost metagenome]